MRMAKLIISTGTFDVDLSTFPNIEKVWTEAAIEPAKCTDSVDVPAEENEGGDLEFLVDPVEFAETTRRDI